jgi:hypothetical protein
MRRIGPIALIAFVLVAPMPAQADHKPVIYCSQTGDICQRTDLGGSSDRLLRIRTEEKYFGRYRLCVIAPNDSKSCDRFRMHRDGSVFKSRVVWENNFPNWGRGEYTVKWKPVSGQGHYGRVLGFHHRGGI